MTKTKRFGQHIADVWRDLVEHLKMLSERQNLVTEAAAAEKGQNR